MAKTDPWFTFMNDVTFDGGSLACSVHDIRTVIREEQSTMPVLTLKQVNELLRSRRSATPQQRAFFERYRLNYLLGAPLMKLGKLRLNHVTAR